MTARSDNHGSMREPTLVRDIRTLVCDTGHGRAFVFVLVETENGLVGVGEASQSNQDDAVVANVRALASSYIGRDVFELIERRSTLYRSDRAGRALIVAASGIEIALWDIMGKVLDVPVYQLLGGASRDTAACYATIAAGVTDRSPSGLAEIARNLVDAGFTAVKILPFAGWEDDPADLTREAAMIARAVERVAAVREAVGNDVGVMVECVWTFFPGIARAVATALEPFNCAWLEAPLLWDDPAELAALRRVIAQKIASGEALHGRRAVRGVLEASAVDILQPDVKWAGGILEVKKVAAWAEACQVLVAPHNNSGPVATAASAHLAVNLANFAVLETPAMRPEWEDELVGDSYPVRDGLVSTAELRRRPGLGIQFDEDLARRIAARSA